jgi:hypothetical protein
MYIIMYIIVLYIMYIIIVLYIIIVYTTLIRQDDPTNTLFLCLSLTLLIYFLNLLLLSFCLFTYSWSGYLHRLPPTRHASHL